MKKMIEKSGIIIVVLVVGAFLLWDKLKKDFNNLDFDLDEEETEEGL
jgi:hypothetical protein